MNPRRDGKEHCKAITLRSGKPVKKLVQANGEDKSKENAENSADILKEVGNDVGNVEKDENFLKRNISK